MSRPEAADLEEELVPDTPARHLCKSEAAPLFKVQNFNLTKIFQWGCLKCLLTLPQRILSRLL